MSDRLQAIEVKSAPVEIARCPEHGLHGDRHECFVCGGPVERVRMVPAAALEAAEAALREAEAERDRWKARFQSLRAENFGEL